MTRVPNWAIEREAERRAGLRMRTPIDIVLADGSTVRADKEEVLQRAIKLLICLQHYGMNYDCADREAAASVIQELGQFAKSLDLFNCTVASIIPMALQIAFDDLERGFTSAIFRKSKPKRISRQSRSEWCVKAFAAACLDILISYGLEDDEAKLFISSIISRTTFKMGRVSTSGPSVVADWRKRFRENDNVAPEDLQLYHQTVKEQKAAPNERSAALKARIDLALSQILRICGHKEKRDQPST